MMMRGSREGNRQSLWTGGFIFYFLRRFCFVDCERLEGPKETVLIRNRWKRLQLYLTASSDPTVYIVNQSEIDISFALFPILPLKVSKRLSQLSNQVNESEVPFLNGNGTQ